MVNGETSRFSAGASWKHGAPAFFVFEYNRHAKVLAD